MRIPVFTYGAVQNIAAGEFDRERPHAEVSGTPEYWPGFRECGLPPAVERGGGQGLLQFAQSSEHG